MHRSVDAWSLYVHFHQSIYKDSEIGFYVYAFGASELLSSAQCSSLETYTCIPISFIDGFVAVCNGQL